MVTEHDWKLNDGGWMTFIARGLEEQWVLALRFTILVVALPLSSFWPWLLKEMISVLGLEVWKRIRDGLPAGQLSFLLRAASNTLPTPLNLRRWKIQCGAKCPLCGNSRPTVAHILNGCPVALEQGHYTWRHDCVLSTITSALRCYIPTETTKHADLPNLRATEHPPSTIPPSMLVTPLKPDLVLHNGDNQATVIELTCSTNTKSNLAAAHSRKQIKEAYGILFSDMANQGWTVDYEVGSLVTTKRKAPSFVISIEPSQKTNTGPPRPLRQSCHLMLLPHFPCKELPQLISSVFVDILSPVS